MNRMMKKAAAAVMSLAMIASAGAVVSVDVLKERPAISASAYQSGYLLYTLNSDGTAKIVGINPDDRWWVQNVVIPEEIDGHTVTGIDALAFMALPMLKKVTIEAQITTLVANVFCSNTSVEEINLPASLTTISAYAFQNCVSLKSITIPYGVNYIGSCAFYNCRNLKKIVFLNKNCQTIASSAFDTNGRSAKVYLANTSTSNKLYKYFKGTDGNGHYSYTVTKHKIGDANSDGSITQTDASKVLQAYVQLYAGNPSGLTPIQEVNADVTGDGKITVEDAQFILMYLDDSAAPALGMAGYVYAVLNGLW